MARDRQLDDTISRWLEEEAPARLPDRVLRATFERTRRSRQRSGWRALLGQVSMPRLVPALGSAAVVVVAAALALNFFANQQGLGSPPAGDPRSFRGTWISTSDVDGGTQTMTVRVSAEGAVEVLVTDTIATVCSGTPSTMTGTGTIDRDRIIIPAPNYTCDDGSEPQTSSGEPLNEQLRNLTYTRDPASDTLTVGTELWVRQGTAGATPEPGATAKPPLSGQMWPQTTIEEVREAQELADAGDPDYAWQIDARLASEDPWPDLRNAEISARFLREVLGWEQFLWNPFQGSDGDGNLDGVLSDSVYLRCAPTGTNPMYPVAPDGQEGAIGAERCGPTIDKLRYETVSLDLAQPGRRGPTGIWVVNRWRITAPFAQADAEAVAADATARLEEFLQARVDGERAEGYVDVIGHESTGMREEVPLLYATTTGAPYERFELERLRGPQWPYGDMEFLVRLFADGGETVVEQQIYLSDGSSLTHVATDTTENGRPVPARYVFFEGEVTVSAPKPWSLDGFTEAALGLSGEHGQRIEFVGHNPMPVTSGCEAGPAAANAETLARMIGSDPDLIATAPVRASVGGADGLSMDVSVAPEASVCETFPSTLVLTQGAGYSGPRPPGVDLDQGSRMRLYLIDLPEGTTTRLLAIAVVAEEARFEQVLEAAAPVIDSIEFRRP